jgi:hypothetical protein
LVKEFCTEQFVKKGMCCDFSIHDKGNGNPHVHIQLTLRALDENGKWLPKCRNEYDLDENGEKIRLPSGAYKRHPVNITDWNKKENSYRDLQLMSLCRHNIIANSSFSWWGAWLGQHEDKVVIAPSKWVRESIINNPICDNWLKIDV